MPFKQAYPANTVHPKMAPSPARIRDLGPTGPGGGPAQGRKIQTIKTANATTKPSALFGLAAAGLQNSWIVSKLDAPCFPKLLHIMLCHVLFHKRDFNSVLKENLTDSVANQICPKAP